MQDGSLQQLLNNIVDLSFTASARAHGLVGTLGVLDGCHIVDVASVGGACASCFIGLQLGYVTCKDTRNTVNYLDAVAIGWVAPVVADTASRIKGTEPRMLHAQRARR